MKRVQLTTENKARQGEEERPFLPFGSINILSTQARRSGRTLSWSAINFKAPFSTTSDIGYIFNFYYDGTAYII